MNANEFAAELEKKTKALEKYARVEFPRMAGRKVLRFIDGNFRAQGWQGRSFLPWQRNKTNTTILIRRGTLRRSINMQTSDGMVRIYTNCPYARVHNRGFNGTVTVKAFTRNKYTATRIGTGRYTKNGNERMKTVHQVSGSSQVKSHIRKMNTPRRQFMPESWDDSPVLVNALRRDVIKAIKQIFN